VQSKVEEKPRQAKRERKTYALTFKLVKSEGRRPVAIQTAFLLTLSFQKTELPPGKATSHRASLLTRLEVICTGFHHFGLHPLLLNLNAIALFTPSRVPRE
jgi:hypothetical protein